MAQYDWIVVGGGLTGAALAYELAKVGLSVLLLEKDAVPNNATRYSYGGIAYWSGTSPITRQLCEEGITIQRQLSEELDYDTQFRELDLLLTIDAGADPEPIAQSYQKFAISPSLLSGDDACDLEPLLSRDAIAGALHYKHGNVNPVALVSAYIQAMKRLGGTFQISSVGEFYYADDRVSGVITNTGTIIAQNVVVCAGAMSRHLIAQAGCVLPIYYTQAELIETPPVDLQLQTMIMPAALQRFQMEAEASRWDDLWDEPGHEVTPPILDAGVIQFQDGHLNIGQISRIFTNFPAPVDTHASEQQMRAAITRLMPALEGVPGTWHSCAVAFSGDRLPFIGALPDQPGLHIFSGFSNPFALLPPLARRFATHLTGAPDALLSQLTPLRFQHKSST
jgi:glycine/D-amino acid oxidase-like deaminating enzyme